MESQSQGPEVNVTPPPPMDDFSIEDFFRKGWEFAKGNIGFLILYELIIVVTMFIFHYRENDWRWSPIHFIGWIIVAMMNIGLCNSALLILEKMKPAWDELYKHWPLLLSWIIAGFLFGLMVTFGLILFVIPGLWAIAAFGFYPFFIVDKGMGPIEALKASFQATKGHRLKILLFYLALILLNLLGALAFGIGLLFTIPFSVVVAAVAYRNIREYALIN